MIYNYFNVKMLASPDLANSEINMCPIFLQKLEQVGKILNKKLTFSSGYRTAAHNLKVGGVPVSAHRVGKAADVICLTGRDKFVFIQACLQVGITRFGIGRSFVHIDIDKTKPSKVFLNY